MITVPTKCITEKNIIKHLELFKLCLKITYRIFPETKGPLKLNKELNPPSELPSFKTSVLSSLLCDWLNLNNGTE